MAAQRARAAHPRIVREAAPWAALAPPYPAPVLKLFFYHSQTVTNDFEGPSLIGNAYFAIGSILSIHSVCTRKDYTVGGVTLQLSIAI